MDEVPLPVIPDLAEVHDIDVLISSYAPELKPHVDRELRRVAWWGLGGVFLLIAVALILGGSVAPVDAILMAMAAVVIGGTANEAFSRFERRFAEHEYRRLLRTRPDILYGRVADKFKGEIERYRVQMLGPGSDWHRARAPLEEAEHEAARSTAYWAERLRQDPDNDLARSNLATAENLRLKFTRALEELDERSDALLTFLNECYAKVTLLESGRSDMEESRRLAALSEHAGEIVSDAESVLRRIGSQFIQEAVRLGSALGALRALQLKDTASDVPLNEIEHVADRILEVYAEDTEAVRALMRAFESSELPPPH